MNIFSGIPSQLRGAFNRFRKMSWWQQFVFLAIFLFSVMWLWLGVYQSHYESALQMLGDATRPALLGDSKEGRADEWATYLPLLKQAYNEGFPARSALEPYRESFEWFISIPHFDLSLLFLPNQAAFWLVPGATALSFQGLYYNALLIFSFCWLLTNLDVRKRFAIPAAVMLLFSQFYQAWWTSNFPVLGALLLPFAVYTSRMPGRYRFPLLVWSIAHLALGQMYPPFVIAAVFGVMPLILAIRPELLGIRKCLLDGLAAAAGLGIYLALKWDFVVAVSHTQYPAHRVSLGGGSSVSTVLSALLPTFPARVLPSIGYTVNELAMVGTIFPLLALALLQTLQWDRVTVRLTVVATVVSAIMIAFMLAPFPYWFVHITGLGMVPGRRMQLGLSLLLLIYSTYIVSKHFATARVPTLLVCVGAYVAVSIYAGVDAEVSSQFFGFSSYGKVCGMITLAGCACSVVFRRIRPAAMIIAVLLVGMSVVHIIVFGSFNPLMRAADILSPVNSQFVTDWKALYAENGYKPFGSGNYGNVLRGEGLPALEAIHMANVDPAIYRSVFPEIPADKQGSTFNNFKGLAFANSIAFDSNDLNLAAPTVVLSLERHGVALRHEIMRGSAAGKNLLTDLPTTSVRARGDGIFDVRWQGVLVKPLPVETEFDLYLKCQVVDSWLTRLPGSIPGEKVSGEALQVAVGRLGIKAADEQAATACVRSMSVEVAQAMRPAE